MWFVQEEARASFAGAGGPGVPLPIWKLVYGQEFVSTRDDALGCSVRSLVRKPVPGDQSGAGGPGKASPWRESADDGVVVL